MDGVEWTGMFGCGAWKTAGVEDGVGGPEGDGEGDSTIHILGFGMF